MIPVVTRWERTETGGLVATEVTNHRINLRDMPSMVNLSHLEIAYMSSAINAEYEANEEVANEGMRDIDGIPR